MIAVVAPSVALKWFFNERTDEPHAEEECVKSKVALENVSFIQILRSIMYTFSDANEPVPFTGHRSGSVKQGEIQQMLAATNRWWRNPRGWPMDDPDLREAGEAPFRYSAGVFDDLAPGGLYVQRGPRRVA